MIVRTINYTIPSVFAGHKISEFLRNQGYAKQNLVELKKQKDSILLNGKWEYLKTTLSEGDQLTIQISEPETPQEIEPADLPFDLVYEDEDIMVVNKPAGMPVHPSKLHQRDSLANAVANYVCRGDVPFVAKGATFATCHRQLSTDTMVPLSCRPFVFRCVNRLDKDTSGLTILAKHFVSCSILYEEVKNREVKREYTAIVEGSDLPDQGTIDLPIGRIAEEGSSDIRRCIDFENGDRAITHYRVISRGHYQGQDIAVVKCNLETGRTHQIRVHMKAIGHPLVGDRLYNTYNTASNTDSDLNTNLNIDSNSGLNSGLNSDSHSDFILINRQALHAGKLEFIHPITKEPMLFEAPVPDDMDRLLKNCL